MPHKQSPLENPSVFDRLVVLQNPASTNAKGAARRIVTLQRLLPDTEAIIVQTSPDGHTANQRLLRSLASRLGPQTLLAIAAGDGTVNLVVETLLTDQSLPEAARQTPLLPLWGGNANDLAHMLNGPAFRIKMSELLRRGRVVAVHPLRCQVTENGGKISTYIATCYAGFGATAFAARQLNDTAHRKRRLNRLPGGTILRDIFAVLSAFVEAPTFNIVEDKQVKLVYERTFTNGSRIAGINRLPLRLTDEMFYLTTLENKRLLSILPRLAEFTRKRMSEKFLHSHASFIVEESVWAQFDGEAVHIPAGSKVTVELSETPFCALSIR